MNKLFLAGVAVAGLAVPVLAQDQASRERQVVVHAGGGKAMTRAEVQSRVREHFAKVDANGDGFVTRDEVRLLAEVRADERRERRFDALDRDKNGSLSREEFEAQGERVIVRSGEGAVAKDRPALRRFMLRRDGQGLGGGMIFAKTDGDKDGRVTLNEALTATLAEFDRADGNRDGTVTPDERRAAFAQRMQALRERFKAPRG